MTESFILGLSSGSACLLTCGMAMFPYLMSEASGTRKITADISVLLLARLAVYFLIATLVWYFGRSILGNRIIAGVIPGILYIVFSVMLIWYSFSRDRERHCQVKAAGGAAKGRFVPLMAGLINSIGFCPALYLMMTRGAAQHNLAESYLGFLAFFAGSSLWFIPVPLAGRFRKRKVFETVGILATGLAGMIFMIKGITIIIGGLLHGN